MRFGEVVQRVTGIKCPIFGRGSNPSARGIDAAKRVINNLEDRRVLFNPHSLEDPHHCIQSVLEMRRLITDALEDPDVPKPLVDNLKAMRAACRKFLNRTQPEDGRPGLVPWRGTFGREGFFDALGEMRGVFGIHVLQIAARYGLDVEDELASILPERDEDGRPRRQPTVDH